MTAKQYNPTWFTRTIGKLGIQKANDNRQATIAAYAMSALMRKQNARNPTLLTGALGDTSEPVTRQATLMGS